MKALLIQVQLSRLPAFDKVAFVKMIEKTSASEETITSFEIIEGDDGGEYINVFFDTDQMPEMLSQLQKLLYGDPECGKNLKHASIMTCQGDHGWDDYLLLHHFDPTQTLDKLGL